MARAAQGGVPSSQKPSLVSCPVPEAQASGRPSGRNTLIAMKLEFRIDFGYLTLYSRRLYHNEMCWDGHLECEGGQILTSAQLRYPVLWFGLTTSAQSTPLPAPIMASVSLICCASFR